MNNEFKIQELKRIIDSKIKFHKNMAKMPFEEKYEIILKLQEIDKEMKKHRNKEKSCKI